MVSDYITWFSIISQIQYISSEWVIKSTIHSNIKWVPILSIATKLNFENSALYGLIHSDFEIWKTTIERHMERLMAARSFKEGAKALSGKQVFKVTFVTLFE
jgi:hypothetical protein